MAAPLATADTRFTVTYPGIAFTDPDPSPYRLDRLWRPARANRAITYPVAYHRADVDSHTGSHRGLWRTARADCGPDYCTD